MNAGAYTYFIWADDAIGNSNMSSSYPFTILSSDAPFIVDNSADAAGTGDSFIVNVTVSDSVMVENFATYNEVDSDDDFVVTTNKIAVTTLRRDADSYVVCDKGPNHFSGDFEHLGKFTIGDFDHSDNGGVCIFWSLSNFEGNGNECGPSADEGVHSLQAFLFVWYGEVSPSSILNSPSVGYHPVVPDVVFKERLLSIQ